MHYHHVGIQGTQNFVTNHMVQWSDQFCIPSMPWREGECRLLGSGRSLNWHNSKLQNNCQDHVPPPPPTTHQKLETERTEMLHLEVLEAFIFSTMWIGNARISRFLVGWFIYVNVEFQLEERCSMQSRYREGERLCWKSIHCTVHCHITELY